MNYHPNEVHLCRNKARQKNKTVSGPRPHQFQPAHHKFFYFLVTKVFYLIYYFFVLSNITALCGSTKTTRDY